MWENFEQENNSVNNNNNDFQNALDDSLNYQAIEKDPQRIFGKYNWEV